ncbi:steroid 17-alpha-hydroxylase/17,20 lyase-like [Xenia sp. Carnegie-2017]|uniref:steroid 17-alpha-hydroxylase/17,20 lyase-like n=1 Tax=Xenia sp. Carnegie-2017 TaxID=2897299 RepID=UPI001F036104|nr:steroid 17-alpha-hydroxylase/17,20 lyase-like [Xenia sp. Carnegie-2017]
MFLEAATLLLVVFFVWYNLTTYLERRKMPPGPYPWPFIGNLLQMDSDPINPFKKLVEKYGEIVSVSFPLRRCVLINTAKLAREARLTRKNDLAGKIPNTMYPGNVIFGERDVICSDFGPGHLFCKKVLTRSLHMFGQGIEKAETRVNYAVQKLVDEVKALKAEKFSPKDLLSRAILCQIWEWLTSKKLSLLDPRVLQLVEFNNKISALWAQFTLVQLIPGMSHLPTKFNKELRELIKTRDKIFGRELKYHRETYNEDVTRDLIDGFLTAFHKEIAKEKQKHISTIDDIQGLMVDLVFAGSDTTSAVLSWFILYVVLHQDVQQNIHDEIDRVVGRNRSPSWQDTKQLNYLQACVCETLRLSRILPVYGTNTTRDTVIGGYHVPKDTYVAININNIHFDNSEWPEPHSFKPERFLDENGLFVGWTTKQALIPFGLGRRECPGQQLARIVICLFASSLMQNFTIEVPEGEKKPIPKPSNPQLVLAPADYNIVAKERI